MPKTDKQAEMEQLIYDLWWFVENATDETPNRTDLFFSLRERMRLALKESDASWSSSLLREVLAQSTH